MPDKILPIKESQYLEFEEKYLLAEKNAKERLEILKEVQISINEFIKNVESIKDQFVTNDKLDPLKVLKLVPKIKANKEHYMGILNIKSIVATKEKVEKNIEDARK